MSDDERDYEEEAFNKSLLEGDEEDTRIEVLSETITVALMELATIWGPKATLLYVTSIQQRMQDELDEAAT